MWALLFFETSQDREKEFATEKIDFGRTFSFAFGEIQHLP